ncbi:MAG: HEAT repeat domain-containing protein [Candidatus Latescibacteria bacterium]|nr:HEAT repeat domain-containing protein [Candidatus Latescibacterota bacterium]
MLPGNQPTNGRAQGLDEKSTPLFLIQLFLVPGTIVAACVAILLLFNWLAGDEKTVKDYLNEVRTERGNRRWQAAYELSQILSMEERRGTDPSVVPAIVAILTDSLNRPEPEMRRYLVLALGRLADKRASRALITAIDDKDEQTRIYAILGLGASRSVEAVSPIIAAMEDESGGVRKAAASSLGALKDPSATYVLKAALNDREEDVRWNAALALAQLSDPSGRATINAMMDRNYLNRMTEMSEENKANVIVNAIRAVILLNDYDERERLIDLSRSDPSMKVRQAAIDALAEMKIQ